MSTSWDIQYIGGNHKYIRGYHEYLRGRSVHLIDTMKHVGDIMAHVEGYHEYIGGCSVHWGFQYKSKAFINLLPHLNHDIPQCTYGIPPMY